MTTLRESYDCLLADLDGVVYVGPHAVPGAVDALSGARRAGLAIGYVTNNANRPAPSVAEHLRELGLELDDTDVVTSAQIAAGLVAGRLEPGSRVLAVGGPGVSLALREQGLEPVPSAEEPVAAVVQGYGPDVGWKQLAEASYAIHGGALWVATNTDLTIPQARGIAPGNGTLVAAVQAAVGIDPVVAGKPQAVAFEAAAQRLGGSRPMVLGDRLDTDIEGANAAGYDSLMVLTGVHGYPELAVAPPMRRPTVLAYDLAALDAPAPAPVTIEQGVATAGDAQVGQVGTDAAALRLLAGTDRVEIMRATLALVWAAVDSGQLATPDQELQAVLAGGVVGAGR